MNRRLLIVCNWLFLLLLIGVVLMARISPWNSYQQNRQVTDNLFLPADYAFGIWNFICLLLIGFALRTTDLMGNAGKAVSGLGKLATQVSPYFWLAAVCSGGWLLCWHLNMHLPGLILMSALFACLLRIFFFIQYSPAPLSYFEHVTLETPFVVFFAWATFLYMSNIASFLAHLGWKGGALNQVAWCCILLALATLIAMWLSIKRPAYSMVCIWVILAIYMRRANEYPLIGYVALACVIVCLIVSAVGFWSRRKVLFGN